MSEKRSTPGYEEHARSLEISDGDEFDALFPSTGYTLPIFEIKLDKTVNIILPPAYKRAQKEFIAERNFVKEYLEKKAKIILEQGNIKSSEKLARRVISDFLLKLHTEGWTSLSRVVALAYGVIQQGNQSCLKDTDIDNHPWIQEVTDVGRTTLITERLTGVALLLEQTEDISKVLRTKYYPEKSKSLKKFQINVTACLGFHGNMSVVSGKADEIIEALQMHDDQENTEYCDIFCQVYRIGDYAFPYLGNAKKLVGYLDTKEHDEKMVYRALERGRAIAEKIALGTYGEYPWVQQKGKDKKGYTGVNKKFLFLDTDVEIETNARQIQRQKKKTPVTKKKALVRPESKIRNIRETSELDRKTAEHKKQHQIYLDDLEQEKKYFESFEDNYRVTLHNSTVLYSQAKAKASQLQDKKRAAEEYGLFFAETAIPIEITSDIPSSLFAEIDTTLPKVSRIYASLIGVQNAVEKLEAEFKKKYNAIQVFIHAAKASLDVITTYYQELAEVDRETISEDQILLMLINRRKTHQERLERENTEAVEQRERLIVIQATIKQLERQVNIQIQTYGVLYYEVEALEIDAETLSFAVRKTEKEEFIADAPLASIQIPEYTEIVARLVDFKGVPVANFANILKISQEAELASISEQKGFYDQIMEDHVTHQKVLTDKKSEIEKAIEILKERKEYLNKVILYEVDFDPEVNTSAFNLTLKKEPEKKQAKKVLKKLHEGEKDILPETMFESLLKEKQLLQLYGYTLKASSIALSESQMERLYASWPEEGIPQSDAEDAFIIKVNNAKTRFLFFVNSTYRR